MWKQQDIWREGVRSIEMYFFHRAIKRRKFKRYDAWRIVSQMLEDILWKQYAHAIGKEYLSKRYPHLPEITHHQFSRTNPQWRLTYANDVQEGMWFYCLVWDGSSFYTINGKWISREMI